MPLLFFLTSSIPNSSQHNKMVAYNVVPLQLVVVAAALFFVTTVHAFGVNYGTLGDNLPSPPQVAQFLKDKTSIDRIKIFDANPDILRAFANTGILVAVTVPNGDIPSLTDVHGARRWLSTNIKPFYPDTHIDFILVGNEILHWGPEDLRQSLVAAMTTLHKALRMEHMADIAVTTAHSLGILAKHEFPSEASFVPGWDRGILAPMLKFHRDTKSPFMVNPYPYFEYSPETADFALFKAAKGVYDARSKKTYDNMFDKVMDSVHVSMEKLGFGDVEIVVGETGWASDGEVFEKPKCSVENALAYNGGLVRHYNAGKGTPLMRNKKFVTYIFSLFNENQKPGSIAERNFGLFRPDFSPVYDIGIMRDNANANANANAAPATGNKPSPVIGLGKKWCVPNSDVSDTVLQNNINYACSQGIDCKPIQDGGACFKPDTLKAHASFAMNSYFHAKSLDPSACDFSGTGVIISTDPSTPACKYVS